MATASSTSSVSEDKPKVHEVDLKMLTWNIAGSKSGKYFADLRGIVVSTMKRQLGDECISFLQEIANPTAVSEWGFPNFDTSIIPGKKEAGLSIPGTALKGQVNLESLQFVTIEYLKGECKVPEEYANRLHGKMVKISTKQPPHHSSNVTLLSYHAIYKTTVEERKKKMKRFFEEMCKLSDYLKQTIIIGGDFNLPILDVKTQVDKLEASGTDESGYRYKGRIIMAFYVATPRRWDNCIDTFAIVHPTSVEHRTECQFGTTIPIYPFPMTNYHKQEHELSTYPPHPACPWFKFVNYSTLQPPQITSIQDTLEKKQKYIRDELSKHEAKVNRDEEKIKTLTEEIEESEEWLLEPYTKEYKGDGPPAPLWPYSPLHKILDHDPVVTTLKIELRESCK